MHRWLLAPSWALTLSYLWVARKMGRGFAARLFAEALFINGLFFSGTLAAGLLVLGLGAVSDPAIGQSAHFASAVSTALVGLYLGVTTAFAGASIRRANRGSRPTAADAP